MSQFCHKIICDEFALYNDVIGFDILVIINFKEKGT